MGRAVANDVKLLVFFPAAGPEGVAQLAERLLADIGEPEEQDERGVVEAASLLKYVSEGKGFAHGRKWGMFTWGIVGNHTDVGVFVEALWPFWQELLMRRGFGERPP